LVQAIRCCADDNRQVFRIAASATGQAGIVVGKGVDCRSAPGTIGSGPTVPPS
jgi:hypothetical protein